MIHSLIRFQLTGCKKKQNLSLFSRSYCCLEVRLRLFGHILPLVAPKANPYPPYRCTTLRRTRLTIKVSMEQNVIVSNATYNERQIRSYQSRVAAQSLRNPCLQTLSKFLSDDNSNQNACRIVCLEFSSVSATPHRENLDLNNLNFLLNAKVQGRKEIQGRILLIEDLSKDVIEMLGSSLNIDPFFFASQLDIPQPQIAITRPYTVTLPSVTKSQNFLTLHYHRVLVLEHTAIKERLLRNMNAPRKLKILPSVMGLDIGLARHCCSILETVGKDGLSLGKRCKLRFRTTVDSLLTKRRSYSC